jgi:hypothetical protein
MASRRLLVVTTVPVPGELLRDEVRRAAGDASADVRIVAPAADVSPLQWLATDDDDARADAADTVEEAAAAVAGEAHVETEVGDSDPVQAIEDALRTFDADEIVVVTPPGEQANWLETDAGAEARNRFGVPVRHLAYDGG